MTIDKVSNNVNEVNDDVNQVVEEAVSENEMVNRGDNENRMRVEVNHGLLVSVYELEREYEDSLNVECEHRENFSRDVECEAETSRMFLED